MMNQNPRVKNTPRSTYSPISFPTAVRPGFRSAINWAIAASTFALVVLAGAIPARATTQTWIVDSGTFSNPANWSPGPAPVDTDVAFFTNDTVYTLSLDATTPLMASTIVSNHAGVFTIKANGFQYNVTNVFRVGVYDSTTTVYVTSSLTNYALAVSSPLLANAQLRIADSMSTNPAIANCVATLVLSNGTVAADATSVGASSNSMGTLIITGNSLLTEGLTASGSTVTIGTASSGNQLIVTNGGRLFVDGTLTVGNTFNTSNNVMIISGPTSSGTFTSFRSGGNGSQFLLNNGAKISTVGSLLFGSNSSTSTGVVDGAGTQMAIGGSFQVGANGNGGTNNLFTVQNGASISVVGTFAYGNNQYHIHDGFVMGGTGLMSTGLFTVIRSASNSTNHDSNFMTVTNAFLLCGYLNPQGPIETVSVLSKGTLQVSNSISFGVPAGNSNSVSFGATDGTLIINGGTLDNRLTSDNVGGISVGGAGGNSLIITNGGKLLTGNGTLGASTSFNTGLVSGVSSVWSNFSNIANYTNVLIVGASAGSSNGNYLAVSDGATLFDGGNLLVGNNAQSSSNSVAFGGPGAAATINIAAALRIGSANSISNNNNQVTVSNATVTCGSILVGQPFQVVPFLTFTTNAGSVVVTNFCVSTNGLIVSSVITNCAPTINTNTVFNVLTINSGTVTAGVIRVVGTNTLVYSGGTLLFTNLQVDGIMTGAATLNVPNNATLQGVGSVANPVTVANGGIVAPGDSVGTLTISNNLVLNSSSVLNYEMGSTANADKLAVVGNLTLDGVLNINTNVSGTFGVGNYTLITYTGGLIDNGLTPPSPFPGLAYTIVAGGGSVVLQVTASGGTDPFAAWQSQYFTGGPSNPQAAPGADPFGKGMSNTNQFLAGFNPTNVTAYLHITAVAKTNSTDVRVDYLGASGDSSRTQPGPLLSRTNVLEFTAGGAGGNYNSNSFASTGVTNVLSGGIGLGTLTNMVDPGGATHTPARYYRVRVLVP